MKFILLSAFLCTVQLFSREPLQQLTTDSTIDVLDCACSTFNNPLKGFESFTVLVNDKSPESELFVQELSKEGHAKKFSLSDPKGIDFEGMGTGVRLMFFLTPLSVIGNASSTITRVSLCLSTSVEVLKTKSRVDSYIWETHLFSTESHISEAVKKAAKQFIAYYKNGNPNSTPVFYIYQ